MNNTNTGGPAFPTGIITDANGVIVGGSNGMTLRDYFAAMAMQGLIGLIDSGKEHQVQVIPKTAYDIADVMLAEREK